MLKSAEEWAYYYQSMAEKKARGQRPNCTVVKNARESHNHTPSCFFFRTVRSESGFPYWALMTKNSLFLNKTLS